MPYTDHTEFPRGKFSQSVAGPGTAIVVADGTSAKVSHWHVAGATGLVTLESADGSTQYDALQTAAAQTTASVDRGFDTDDAAGLRVNNQGTAAVHISVFYIAD